MILNLYHQFINWLIDSTLTVQLNSVQALFNRYLKKIYLIKFLLVQSKSQSQNTKKINSSKKYQQTICVRFGMLVSFF